MTILAVLLGLIFVDVQIYDVRGAEQPFIGSAMQTVCEAGGGEWDMTLPSDKSCDGFMRIR